MIGAENPAVKLFSRLHKVDYYANIFYICLIDMKRRTIAVTLIFLAPVLLAAADTYQKPPKDVMEILNSPTTPVLSIGPTHAYAMQGSPVRYPPLAEIGR